MRKDRKSQKSRSEEKVMGFSSVSLFPTRKREAVTQGRTMLVNHVISSYLSIVTGLEGGDGEN